MTVSQSAGCVYVVSTPIGNLEDLSPRGLRVLQSVAVIACEDTRHTARLCQRFSIPTPRISLHARNEQARVPALLERLEQGKDVALVCDAGTPLLSDPGARLVQAAIERAFRVVPVPGPSAVLAGLVASGLATRPFTFVGFLPRKGTARRRWMARLQTFPGTLILFEAPGRVAATLRDLHAALGARDVVVARELTKRYEEILHGKLGMLEVGELRGEVTLIVEGGEPLEDPKLDSAQERAFIEQQRVAGLSSRDIAIVLARRQGISRTVAYRRVISLESGSSKGD